MPEKTVRQLMADIAPLAVFMMCIVVNDGRLYSNMSHHRREFSVLRSLKQRAVTRQLGHAQDIDFKLAANSGQINAVGRR